MKNPGSLGVILALLFAYASPMTMHAKELVPERPGTYKRTFKAEGLKLRLGLEVPTGEITTPRPLILALHYGFDRGQPFPHYYGKAFMERVVSPGFESLGAFVVAPDSHGMSWADPKIFGAVLELLDVLVADPRVDGEKVVVTGYSMGGAGTWYFATEQKERFAAAVPMAGRLKAEWVDQSAGLAIHVLHSRQDELIPFGQVQEILQAKRAENIRFTIIEGVTHFRSEKYAEPLAKLIVPWLRDEIFADEDAGPSSQGP